MLIFNSHVPHSPA